MRLMKFWELVSAFREEPSVVLEVVSRPEWQEPYRHWLGAHGGLVDRQDREVLDATRSGEAVAGGGAPLRPALRLQPTARHRARVLAGRGARSRSARGADGARGPRPLRRCWVIEQVGEYGSLQVTPSQVDDEVYAPPPPAPPRPQSTREELQAEIRRLLPTLDANPRDHNARYALANALIGADRPQEAIPHLLAIADFFWNDGLATVARGYLRRASRVDASHPDVVARQKEWGA